MADCATCAREVIPGPHGRCPVCGAQVVAPPAQRARPSGPERLLASCLMLVGLTVGASTLGGLVGLLTGGVLAGVVGALALPVGLVGSVAVVAWAGELALVLVFPLWVLAWILRRLRGTPGDMPDPEAYPFLLFVTPLTGAAGWAAGALTEGATSAAAIGLAVTGVLFGLGTLLILAYADRE